MSFSQPDQDFIEAAARAAGIKRESPAKKQAVEPSV